MLEPFSVPVWIWNCIRYALVVGSWYLISKLSYNMRKSNYKITNVTDVALLVFGLQVSQSTHKTVFKSLSISIIFTFCLISSFFLTSTYIANIKASYLVTKPSSKIESLDVAMADQKMQLIIGKGTNMETMVTTGASDVFKEAAKRIRKHPENLINQRKVESDCLDRVRYNDNMACATIRSRIIRYIARYPNDKLYLTKNSVTSGLVHMVLKKGFRHKNAFNDGIASLWQMGKNCLLMHTYIILTLLNSHINMFSYVIICHI